MSTLRIHVDIPEAELLRWYRGEARTLIARSDDGRRVALPVAVMRRFVTRQGLRGSFLLTLDHRDRFVSLRQLGERRR